MSKLQRGDSAPDLTVADHAGRSVRLSEFWTGQPLVLMFLRHLG